MSVRMIFPIVGLLLLAAHAALSSVFPSTALRDEPTRGVVACAERAPSRWGVDDGTEGTYSFDRNGFVYLRVCRAGVLDLELRGSDVDGIAALLVVALGDQRLAELRVSGAQSVSIDVPYEGWLMLAFVNRHVGTEGRRSLWIERVEFRSR